MLKSINQLYRISLGASDGEIGRVKDFYFDDWDWAIRYVVADTGSWLSELLVLISPHAIGSVSKDAESLLVNLTRNQIENSPSIEAHKPVSRQYEEAYHRYYGWPPYWSIGGMFGVAGISSAPLPLTPQEQPNPCSRSNNDDDPHLRSTQTVSGYHIQTGDDEVGHITDFLVNDETWTISHMVVETGHWYSGKEIVIAVKEVERISYEGSTVFVGATRKSIMEAPQYHASQFGEDLCSAAANLPSPETQAL